MFNFLQVSAFFANQSSDEAVVGQDFQRNLFCQFGLISLFLHNLKNHAAGFRCPFWGGVDCDRLLGSPRVLLPVDVYPIGEESGAMTAVSIVLLLTGALQD